MSRPTPMLASIVLGLGAVMLAPAAAAAGSSQGSGSKAEYGDERSSSDAEGTSAEASEGDAASEGEAATPSAGGRERLREAIRVIQRRPVLRDDRAEIYTMGGLGLEDDLFRNVRATGGLRWHVASRWSVGVGYAHYFSKRSDTFHDVADKYGVFPERASLQWFAGAEAAWIPLEGKFDAFGSRIVFFDLALLGGAGAIRTNVGDAIEPAGQFGVRWRVYANRWLAFSVEFRDYIYAEDFRRGSQVMNHLVFQGGLSFFFPSKSDYRF